MSKLIQPASSLVPATQQSATKSRSLGNSTADSQYNATVLNTLGKGTKSGSVFACLYEYEMTGNASKPRWPFLVNPESLGIKNQMKVGEAETQGSRCANIQYQSASGQTLSLKNIVMETWYLGLEQQSLLDGLNRLLEADIDKNIYSAPLLSFVMGAYRFGPCFLSSIQYDIKAMLNGAPAYVVMSLELREVLKAKSRGQKEQDKRDRSSLTRADKQAQGNLRNPLTPRQQSEAIAAAKKFLSSQKELFTGDIQALINTDKYKLAVDTTTGDVNFSNASNKVLGAVFRWDGSAAVVNTTTLPKIAARQKK